MQNDSYAHGTFLPGTGEISRGETATASTSRTTSPEPILYPATTLAAQSQGRSMPGFLTPAASRLYLPKDLPDHAEEEFGVFCR